MAEYKEMKDLVDEVETLLMDDDRIQRLVHVCAMRATNIMSEEEFEQVSKDEDENPKYGHYWAATTMVLQTALGRVIGKMYYAHEEEQK